MDLVTRGFGPMTEKEWRARGAETENRFFAALEAIPSKPSWFLGVRRASNDEDYNGYDAFVKIDTGEVPIQIKTSYFGAQEYLRAHQKQKVIIMVIPPTVSEKIIQQDIILKLTAWRDRQLKTMSGWKQAWIPLLAYVSTRSS